MNRVSTNDAVVLSSIGRQQLARMMNAHQEQAHITVIMMKITTLRLGTAAVTSRRQARKKSQTTSTATTIPSAEALIKLVTMV